MAAKDASLQDLPLTRKQAEALVVAKVKKIFEEPSVLEAVKVAIRDPKNPLELSAAEQKTFQALDGGLQKAGRLPGLGRIAKGAANALDNRIKDEAVSSDRSKKSRNALLDSLGEDITVAKLEAAMEEMGEYVKEFSVLGFDDPERIKNYVPKGRDADAYVDELKHFSAKELQDVGALERNWQQRVEQADRAAGQQRG